MLRSDHILGGLAAGAGLFLLIASFSIPVSGFITTLSAQFFPRLLAVAFVALGLYLALRARPDGFAEAMRPLLTMRYLAFVLVVGIYFLTFRYIDFRLSTAVFLFLTMLLLGSRRVLELVLVPVLGALTVWVIFRYGFSVLLPTWI